MLGESEILAFLPENFRFFFLVREFDTLDHVAAPLPAHDRGHAEPSALYQGFRLPHSLQNNGSCARPVSVSIRKLHARHDAPRRSDARALLSSPLLSPESRRYRCRLMPRVRQLWHLYQVRTKGIYQQRLTR